MARRRRRHSWEDLPKQELLDLRFCDLGLKLEGTWIEPLIEKVLGELSARGLDIEPSFWLSDEWFSPDGVVGVALPFYLAHPRLLRLERSEVYEAEGSSRRDCVRFLRHEVGHALDHAYVLHKRRRWQEVFGRSSLPYPDYYRPNPASRKFVQHLDGWYAQSHPYEDFAETFAVWLTPRSRWRQRYEQWPHALHKLEYVEELMGQLASERPRVRARAPVHPLSRMRRTLRQHYEAKKDHYAVDYPSIYDRDLLKVFAVESGKGRESASKLLRRNRVAIRRAVARWTGQYQFTLEQVLNEMIARAGELRLRVAGPERELVTDFTILLTVKTMDHLYRERHWIPA
jgi:hypothetical protein